MPYYLHATVKVKPGKMAEFISMITDVKVVLNDRGWKLVGGYISMVGRPNTVVDIWEMPDFQSFQSVVEALPTVPGWPELAQRIADTVEEETTHLMCSAPYFV